MGIKIKLIRNSELLSIFGPERSGPGGPDATPQQDFGTTAMQTYRPQLSVCKLPKW